MLQKFIYSLKIRGPLGTVKLALTYFFWYWKKIFSKDRRFLKKFSSFRMYLNLDDPGLSTTVGRGGTREKDQAKVLVENLKLGMNVLDIPGREVLVLTNGLKLKMMK